jgi:hypothetical protein
MLTSAYVLRGPRWCTNGPAPNRLAAVSAVGPDAFPLPRGGESVRRA